MCELAESLKTPGRVQKHFQKLRESLVAAELSLFELLRQWLYCSLQLSLGCLVLFFFTLAHFFLHFLH